MPSLIACFRGLVHESARSDALALARHQSFIASHLIGGSIALFAFGLYVAMTGRPSLVSMLAFAWLLSPLAIALFLSWTGRLAAAHLISAVNLAGLVTVAAAMSGGITSFLIPWMLVVPLEAALSADRRVVLTAIAAAGLSLLAIAAAGEAGLLPPAPVLWVDSAALALLGSLSAVIYAGGLAVAVQVVHRQSEEAIRVGEDRYRLLAENATDMITRHNARGDVVFASLGGGQIIGEPTRHLLGRGLLDRVHVSDRPQFLSALAACAARGDDPSVEFRLRRGPLLGEQSRGHFVWVEMRCRRIEGPDGAAEIVAVTRDISERKQQEIELLKARDEAETASLAKTRFLANVSHELRTPLNAIIGFSEIIMRELYGPLGQDRYRDYARLIHESGAHLLSVVNEILDMSKIEAGKFKIFAEPFAIETVVTPCCEIMRHGAEQKSIRLQMDIEPNLPELVADKRACKQMLLNLLSNAIKFTGHGGSVRVSARRRGSMLELAVADTGIGISHEDLPKLGNPFVQAETSYNRNFEGAGLGLSVVKGLAALHGGRMEIESELNCGTIARVLLPFAALASAAEAPAVDKRGATAMPGRLQAHV